MTSWGSGENRCPAERQIAEPESSGSISGVIGVLLPSPPLPSPSSMEMIQNRDFAGGSVMVSLPVLRKEHSKWFNFPGREQVCGGEWCRRSSIGIVRLA